MLSATSIFNFS